MGSMSDLGLPERLRATNDWPRGASKESSKKGMLAILEQLFCKYWNRLEDCHSASPASIGIY